MRQRGCACARHGDAMRCDAIPAVRARSGQKRQRPPPPASRSRPDVDALPGELRGIALTRPRRPAAHRALTERPFHRPVPAARARERGRTEAERGSGAVCQRRAAGLGSEERTNQNRGAGGGVGGAAVRCCTELPGSEPLVSGTGVGFGRPHAKDSVCGCLEPCGVREPSTPSVLYTMQKFNKERRAPNHQLRKGLMKVDYGE